MGKYIRGYYMGTFLAIYTIEQCVLKCEYEFSRSRVKYIKISGIYPGC